MSNIQSAMFSDLSDSDLVRRTLNGEAEAYNVLIERYTPLVYRVVRRMCSDRAEAEAITQEAFLRAWEALPRSKYDQPFKPWVIQIAVNAARDTLRKLHPLDFADLPEDEPADWSDAALPLEDQLTETELLTQLAAAVDSLPAPYRMVIALRYKAELSYEDIAAAMHLPVNTVRTHLHRAKQQLRRDLGGLYP